MAGSDWNDGLIAQWQAERESRPTEKELSYWPTTVSELRMKLAIQEDISKKGDLYHRLAIALVKMEDYRAALDAVEEGLGQKLEGWKDLLLMDKAEVLYLLGREKEALALVEGLAPQEERVERGTPPPSHDKITITEVRLLCPDCGGEARYGSKACPHCGREVGEGFQFVRRPASPRSVDRYSIAQQKYQSEEEPHRTKSFSILFTTYTVDYDDPQNFLTTHRERIMGQEITIVNDRGWYVSMATISLIIINIFMMIFLLSAIVNDTPSWFLALAGVMWALLVIPMVGFFLWVLRPPNDYPSSL